MSDQQALFWSAPDEEKRVIIARDVLSQIKINTIRPRTGLYLHFTDYIEDDLKVKFPLPAHKVFSESDCYACAIGACFYSLIVVGDQLLTRDVVSRDGMIHPSDIRPHLYFLFTREQLALIESAFERRAQDHANWCNRKEVGKAVQFGEAYRNAPTRMRAIMKNIIQNNGTFVP